MTIFDNTVINVSEQMRKKNDGGNKNKKFYSYMKIYTTNIIKIQ